VSVLILTKNEESDLPACLASVSWSDDVHVLDSQSTDGTVELARAAGASVTVRRFDGYASQRNFGLQLPFKNDWVLLLDADERMPDAAWREILAFAVDASAHVAGGRLRRRDIWWGRWLKHAQISPFFIRLVRVGRARYEREINEVLRVDGDIVDLREPFDHFPFSKGLDHWLAKHNVYSRMEAELIAHGGAVVCSWRTALLGADFNERRVHQKALFYRMPARPLVKFLYMVVWRRALLDGWPGVRYAILQSIYEYMIVLKVRELEQAARVPRAAP
jgi:glycosyltransferase involved in cell wall biosynthesis